MAIRPYVITDLKAIRLLGSPLRQAMIDAIVARGPATVAELAEQFGKPPDRLYYHVRLLEGAGLLAVLAEQGAAASNGRSEATYDVPGRPMLLKYDRKASAARAAVRRVVTAVLRSAKRDFAASLEQEDVRVDGPRRELWSGRTEAHLTGAEVEELNEALKRVQAIMGRARTPGAQGAKPYQFTWAFSPLARR
jgi:DNA-binding transcriptional ArsR family regulator